MKTYTDIFNDDIYKMKKVLSSYGDGKNSFDIFYTLYKDPDGYALSKNGLRSRDGIECTVDAITSINRIFFHEGFNENFIESFSLCREFPLIFFPKEYGGINTTRFSKLGDRIDYTIFDLKQYFEGNPCKLGSAYIRPKTQKWLESFNKDFGELIRWFKVDGIFVDNNNCVYDLEKNDGSIITNHKETYEKKWSDNYYKNVKEKVIECRR